MTPKFHIKEDSRHGWRWYLTAVNGQVIAQSPDSYASLSGVRNGIEAVRRAVHNAEIIK